MQVTEERPQPCEAVLTIEVDDQQLEEATSRAYREFAKVVNVPGFRPGKAPRAIVEQMLKDQPGMVNDRVREIAIDIAYRKALQQSDIQPYDQGSVDELEEPEAEDGGERDATAQNGLKPFSFKATVPLRPTVELGDYSSLTATRNSIPVTDEDVQGEIDRYLQSNARLDPGTDPAADDDLVFADLDTSVDGKPLGETRTATFQIGQNMAEVDAALRGAVANETRETDVEYPEDYNDPSLAGKKVHFTFRINHVLTRRVPELTDEWAQEHARVESVEELRNQVRATLEVNARRAEEEDLRRQLLEQVAAASTVHFPTKLVDREVAEDLRNLNASLEERGSNIERYLEQTNTTLPQLQDQMALTATQRIRNGLVMGRLAQVENLDISHKEIQAEIARIAELNSMRPAELRRRLKSEGQLAELEERLLQDKLFAFLKNRAGLSETTGAETTTGAESA